MYCIMHKKGHNSYFLNIIFLALKISHFSTKTPQPVILAPWSLKASLLPNQPLVKGVFKKIYLGSIFALNF